MSDILNAQPTQGFSTKFPAFARAESRALGLIALSLIIWFSLAQIAGIALPDTSADSLAAGKSYMGYAARNGLTFMFFAAMIGMLVYMHKSGDGPIIHHIRGSYVVNKSDILLTPIRLALALVSFAIFIFSYSAIKVRIPEISTFSWDVAFYEMDRALFLGRDPWTVFAWIYDMPGLLTFMDTVYDMWAALLVGTWALCFVLSKTSAATRFRFPLAVIITWFIGGNVAALLLSSAGPCYFGAVTGLPDPYAAQMASLAVLDAASTNGLRAFTYQDILWGVYQSPSLGLGGISAMPSMHCATSFLFVLLAWKKPVLRYLALAFFTFILISSFVLAWHYAVDGILAVPIALLGWHLAGVLGRVISRAPKEQPA